MKRNIIDKLISWKNQKTPKSILVTGVKGVGKTYLIYDFAKAFFKHVIYVNFENQTNIRKIFEISDSSKLRDKLIEIGSNRNPNLNWSKEDFKKVILILDEVFIDRLILKKIDLLNKEKLFPYIALISSNSTNVDFNNKEIKKLKHITVYPLAFDEFLRALNHDWYVETIITHYKNNKPIPDILHKELLELHKLYLQTGGMPSIINEYMHLSTTINLIEQHKTLMGYYYNYIEESDMGNQSLKMKQVLECLPLQLKKANKKFQYSIIRKGTTYAMYKKAIDNLAKDGYCLRCNKFSSPSNAFKLYMSDVGFLYSGFIKEGINLDRTHVQGALLENYVAQTLNSLGYPLYFWESDSTAKIEFIIKKDNCIIPIEVHRGNKTRSKSINAFKQTTDFPYAIKISSKNFGFINQTKYLPYYATFCI